MGPEEGLAWTAARGVTGFISADKGSGGVTFRATPAFEARCRRRSAARSPLIRLDEWLAAGMSHRDTVG